MDNFEETVTKNRILSQNKTFKTAFVATLGFYTGQFVVTILGLGVIGLIFFIGYQLLK